MHEPDPATRVAPSTLPNGLGLSRSADVDYSTSFELALLCKHAPAYHREVVTVLALTGLRISEVLALKWRDVDLVEREMHVRGQLSRGSKKRPPRIVRTKTAGSSVTRRGNGCSTSA